MAARHCESAAQCCIPRYRAERSAVLAQCGEQAMEHKGRDRHLPVRSSRLWFLGTAPLRISSGGCLVETGARDCAPFWSSLRRDCLGDSPQSAGYRGNTPCKVAEKIASLAKSLTPRSSR